MTSRRRWRRWLLNIHLYGGLICSGYLLVYGVSSLLFNHRTDRLVGVASTREWTRPIAMPPGQAQPLEAARHVADGLGLDGRIPTGAARWETADRLRFELLRPGRSYDVRVERAGRATVVEQRRRPAAILLGLHDARAVPTSALLTSWWYYTHLTVGFLLFMAISGVVLWVSTRRARGLGWPMLLGGTVGLVALVAWLVA